MMQPNIENTLMTLVYRSGTYRYNYPYSLIIS